MDTFYNLSVAGEREPNDSQSDSGSPEHPWFTHLKIGVRNEGLPDADRQGINSLLACRAEHRIVRPLGHPEV